MKNENGGGASRSTEPASGTSAATDVSLREHLGTRIAYERESTRLLFGFVLSVGAFAWSLIQWRLQNLNHENARLLAQQAQTVSADTYAANEAQRKDEARQRQAWESHVNDSLTKAVTKEEVKEETGDKRRANFSVTAAIIGVALAIVIAVVGFAGVATINDDTPPASPVVVTTTVTVPSK